MTKDYYKILGVTEFDSAENIKIAYRKLARQWHPDLAGTSEEVLLKFKEINEAYEILSNKIKKTEYDKAKSFYDYANKTKKTNTEEKTKNNQTAPQNNHNKFKWEDFLNNKTRENTYKKEKIKSPINGSNINTEIVVNELELIHGTTKVLNILQTEICEKCNGKKFINGSICPNCNGKGEFSNYKKFHIKIPAGIKNNSKIRLAGEGSKGKFGGKNGDLYVTIKIQKNENYEIKNLNINKTIAITPAEAVLGTEINLSTINGLVKLKIAPRTQNGQKICLSGLGIIQNNNVGDMIINVEIKIPSNLSEKEIELYKKLQEISSNDIRNDL